MKRRSPKQKKWEVTTQVLNVQLEYHLMYKRSSAERHGTEVTASQNNGYGRLITSRPARQKTRGMSQVQVPPPRFRVPATEDSIIQYLHLSHEHPATVHSEWAGPLQRKLDRLYLKWYGIQNCTTKSISVHTNCTVSKLYSPASICVRRIRSPHRDTPVWSHGLKLQISTVVLPARRHRTAHISRVKTTFHTVSHGAVISRRYMPEPTSKSRTRPSFPPVTRNCSSNCREVTDESCAAIRVCTRKSGSTNARTRPSAPPETRVCGVNCSEHTSAV